MYAHGGRKVQLKGAEAIAALEAEERRHNMSNGHGVLTQITDQKEFFDAAKKSKKMIIVMPVCSEKTPKQLLRALF